MKVVKDKIKVAIRIKPLDPDDINTIKIVNNQLIIKDKKYKFDNIFNTETEQKQIYEVAVRPLIQNFLLGDNVTIFAYGQTSSGKTYTMGTNQTTIGASKMNLGIIPRFISEIFQHDENSEVTLLYSIQFLELYNEEIRDLLCENNSNGNNIKISENKSGVNVSGLKSESVQNFKDALHFLNEGNLRRTVGSTAMNAESSRSHAIFTFFIHSRRYNMEMGRWETVRKSKFNFVDLAGSERLGRTMAVGTRAREGISINSGLLALGNVMCALSDGVRHVPYRDSKLTRLLSESLGGNARCLMLACVSGCLSDLSETCNTLNYAGRVGRIENRLVMVCTSADGGDKSELDRLRARVDDLEKEIASLKHKLQTKSEYEDEFDRVIGRQQKSLDVLLLPSKGTSILDDPQPTECAQTLMALNAAENHARLLNGMGVQMTTAFVMQNLKVESLRQETACFHGIEPNSSDCGDIKVTDPYRLLNLYTEYIMKFSHQNGLILNRNRISASSEVKMLHQERLHEMRWRYLWSFVVQPMMVRDAVQSQLVTSLQSQLSRTQTYVHRLVQRNEDVLKCISNANLYEHLNSAKKIFSQESLTASHNAVISKLDHLFPLLPAEFLGRHCDATMKKPIVKAIPAKPWVRTIRQKSTRLKNQTADIDLGNKEFVRRNGLCLPVISLSPARPGKRRQEQRPQSDWEPTASNQKRARILQLSSETNMQKNLKHQMSLIRSAKLVKKARSSRASYKPVDVLLNFRMRMQQQRQKPLR